MSQTDIELQESGIAGRGRRITRAIGDQSARLTVQYMPDPFTFAALMTFAVFVASFLLSDLSLGAILGSWNDGFWSLLSFGMQMTLIVSTGYALAAAPSVRRRLASVASRIGTPIGAVIATGAMSGIVSYLHWGLGTILTCFFAVEVARSAKARGIRCHFPLLIAAAYSGTAIAMAGLSSSAGLLMNTPGHFMEDQVGLIPLTDTIFLPRYLMIVGLSIVAAPLVLAALHPRERDAQPLPDFLDESDEERDDPTFAAWIGTHPLLGWTIGAIGIVTVVLNLSATGLIGIQLNVLNMFILMLGILLHGSLRSYASALSKGAFAAGGVILLFPFYGGILGVMRESGFVEDIAAWFVSFSTAETFGFWTMVSGALINFAIPSAGGQWAIQGPIAVLAADRLDVSVDVAVVSVMLGESLTNLAMPLWLVPLLGITGLKAGEILGYTIVLMFVLGLLFGFGLLFF